MSYAQFKQARIEKGWSQKQLAYFSGLSVEKVRKLEHGQTNPRMNSLALLADALGYKLIIGLTK